MKLKTSEETAQLKAWLEQQPPGAELTYQHIEKETGIKMDSIGKSKLRSALKSLKQEYDTRIGKSIVLASATNGVSIIGGKLARVDSAIKSSHKSQQAIQAKFFNDMTPEDQKKVMFIGSVFAAMHEYSKRCRSLQSPVVPANFNTPILGATE